MKRRNSAATHEDKPSSKGRDKEETDLVDLNSTTSTTQVMRKTDREKDTRERDRQTNKQTVSQAEKETDRQTGQKRYR